MARKRNRQKYTGLIFDLCKWCKKYVRKDLIKNHIQIHKSTLDKKLSSISEYPRTTVCVKCGARIKVEEYKKHFKSCKIYNRSENEITKHKLIGDTNIEVNKVAIKSNKKKSHALGLPIDDRIIAKRSSNTTLDVPIYDKREDDNYQIKKGKKKHKKKVAVKSKRHDSYMGTNFIYGETDT